MTSHNNQTINNHPIGIFDSGVGGLSIAKQISLQLPNEQLIYVADSAYAPYGDISVELIQQRVNKIADWLVSNHCKALVIACNTATVNAIDQLRERLTIPIIGVEPAIKPAALTSITKNIGILVTQATANNQRFLALIERYKNGSSVYIQPCLGLVELIEQGQQHTVQCRKLLKSYLTPLIDNQVDTVVLGCTHYPFIGELIKEIMPEDVTLMESATPVSEQLTRQLTKFNLLSTQPSPLVDKFYTSNLSLDQHDVFNQLWGSDITIEPL